MTIENLIRAIVREELEAALSASALTASTPPIPESLATYSSRDLPPDCPSRDRFRRLARQIANERGSEAAWKAGACWFVTRTAWATHRPHVVPPPGKQPKRPNRPADEDDAEVMRRSNLRVVSGG